MTANSPKSVVLFGATGTIGRATSTALQADGHSVTRVIRPGSDGSGDTITAEVSKYAALDLSNFDAVVSCLASRSGAPDDAWAIDHDAHQAMLTAAQQGGVSQFVLLSALCVQKPRLEFQKAKLAFENNLIDGGLTYSIVRPTAFFKSLSGQVKRLQDGKPFLLFGDGTGTACKPISDRDLGHYLSACLSNPDLQDRILPIGGPGPAITPRAQGEMLFDLLGRDPAFRAAPLWLMDAIIGGLTLGGLVLPRLRAKAELARIGRYYATESMLVWDSDRYDADATPSFGKDRLEDHYRAMIAGDIAVDLGDHAVF